MKIYKVVTLEDNFYDRCVDEEDKKYYLHKKDAYKEFTRRIYCDEIAEIRVIEVLED